jgi:hypothetical protein
MKRIDPRIAGAVALVIGLGACVTPPVAPTIPVAPGLNKSFDAFAADQATCQQYATAQTAPQAYAATNQAVLGARPTPALRRCRCSSNTTSSTANACTRTATRCRGSRRGWALRHMPVVRVRPLMAEDPTRAVRVRGLMPEAFIRERRFRRPAERSGLAPVASGCPSDRLA